jgi:hypothetical protein
MAATIVVAKNTSYDSDINCCCEILVMSATLIVLAKLFATAPMTATCSNIFFYCEKHFLQQLYVFGSDICRCQK